MPNRTLLRYSVTQKGNSVLLKGTLSASHTYDKIIIERGGLHSDFVFIAELPVGTNVIEYAFSYFDEDVPEGDNYYRIRLVNTVHNLQEISNVWLVELESDSKGLELRNTMLQACNPVLTISSKNEEPASLQVTSLSGHPVYNSQVSLNEGINNFNLYALSGAKGFFIVTIKNKEKIVSQRIIVQ
jgi:hypothetical protein